jgi:hypothetical protein
MMKRLFTERHGECKARVAEFPLDSSALTPTRRGLDSVVSSAACGPPKAV